MFVKTISMPKNSQHKNDKDYVVKTFSVEDVKVVEEKGKTYVSGYANTKNKPDSYGDIPTNFNGQPVYDLSRFKKNPVMFMNHDTLTHCAIGTFVELVEDEIGLFFKALLMPIDECYYDKVKQTISAFKLGVLRALSIGGRWYFDDPKNPSHLTRAYIYEISVVGVGADEDALAMTPKPKSHSGKQDQVAEDEAKELEVLRIEYESTQTINEFRKELQR